MRALLLLALLPAAALAQAPAAPPDTTAADSSLAASLAAELAADSLAQVRRADSLAAAAPAPTPRASVALRAGAERATAPVRYQFGATGLRVTLPPGWDGPRAAMEARLPGYALYTLLNETPGHPLRGAVLRVERVVGLNEFYRHRWMNGQTTYGYHGSEPVGPANVPLPGTGLEVRGLGTGGAVAFTQSRGALWAVQIEAPAELWARERGALLAVLAGVDLP